MEAKNYSFTHHADVRTSQRGISQEEIQSVVESGICIRKQGLRFYFGGNKIADKLHEEGLPDSTKNLVVVMDGEKKEIITCYKNERGLRNIRKKSKRLC